MTREEIIKWLESLKAEMGKSEHSALWHYAEAIDKAIEALSADVVQEWIPCSERLPEYDGGMYLVTDYCEQINRRRIHISYCYVNREGFWSDIPISYKVIAWMPLPTPYKESDPK